MKSDQRSSVASLNLQRKNEELGSEQARLQELNRQLQAEIEERKRAEAAVRLSEQRYRRIVELAPEAIVVVDLATGNFVDFNPQALTLFKLSADEILRVGPETMSPPVQPDGRTSADAARALINQALAGEIPVFEWIHRNSLGADIPCEIRLLRLPDESRLLVRGTVTDITERKQVEQALRASEERFFKAFSLGPHRMGIIRREDGVILDVNDRWVQETGFQREEIIGTSVLEIATLIRGEEGAGIRQLLETGKPFRDVEVHVTTKAGEERVVLSSAEVFELRGVSCLLVAANDITERKQAEERIALLQMIIIDVAATNDLASALEVVLRRVCEKTGWALGQAWIPNLQKNTLDCSPAWYASAPGLDNFRNSTKDLTFLPGQGLPGRVWASGQPVWLRDVTMDSNFPRAGFAGKAGLKAGLGIPIRSGDEVVAVIEFFMREPRDEDERLVEVISAVAAQIGMVVERKRADEALRASEERFSKAFSLAPQRMSIIRIKDGMVLYVNDRWVRETGFAREEVVNKPIFELNVWLGDQERSWSRRLLEEGKPFHNLEGRLSTKAGEERIALASAEVIELNGEPCMLWAANDITERQRAEEALHALERRFSIAFNANPIPSSISTFAGGRFLAVNEQFLQITGYTREEVIGHTAGEFGIWSDPEERGRVIQLLKTEGRVRNVEVRLLTKSREERMLLLWIETIELEGQSCLLHSGLDITERKRTEDALRASQHQLRALSARLQSAREEEGMRIAREIHDELGGAMTGLKWDLEGIDKQLSETGAGPKLSAVRKKLGVMTSLIESTIDIVRRISSELRPGLLDDLGLIAAIDWQAQQFHSRTGIKYHSDTALETIDLSRESATAVFRIFQEILTNVLRHSQAANFYVTLREQDGYLELEVSDDGRGITESERGNTRSLGLLGMKERALLVGGQVSIDGRNGEGTRVAVRVPLGA